MVVVGVVYIKGEDSLAVKFIVAATQRDKCYVSCPKRYPVRVKERRDFSLMIGKSSKFR